MDNLTPEEARSFNLEEAEGSLSYDQLPPPLPGESAFDYQKRIAVARPRLARGAAVGASRPSVVPGAPGMTTRQLQNVAAVPGGTNRMEVGDITLRWDISGIDSDEQFAPIPFGGGDVLEEPLASSASAQLLSSITGKSLFSAGYAANPNAPYVTSISGTLGHSLLYNVNRPYYAHLLRLLRTRSVIIPRIRISAAQSAFNTFLQRMNVTLVTVTSLRQEETNATILSAYFSPDQFQDNIIDIVFPTPIVIRPYQFILFDVPGTSGGDIANGAQTTFMNINFLGVRIVQGDFS